MKNGAMVLPVKKLYSDDAFLRTSERYQLDTGMDEVPPSVETSRRKGVDPRHSSTSNSAIDAKPEIETKRVPQSHSVKRTHCSIWWTLTNKVREKLSSSLKWPIISLVGPAQPGTPASFFRGSPQQMPLPPPLNLAPVPLDHPVQTPTRAKQRLILAFAPCQNLSKRPSVRSKFCFWFSFLKSCLAQLECYLSSRICLLVSRIFVRCDERRNVSGNPPSLEGPLRQQTRSTRRDTLLRRRGRHRYRKNCPQAFGRHYLVALFG
jgi:hypothetical protein